MLHYYRKIIQRILMTTGDQIVLNIEKCLYLILYLNYLMNIYKYILCKRYAI